MSQADTDMPGITYPLLSLARLRMGTDGVGVTTLIGGAGCPLSCRWCINQRLLRETKAHPVSVEELIDRVKIDDLYFQATGGGVTFGGGESLLHSAFIRQFRKQCPSVWRISVETSLAVPEQQVSLAAECVDEFIVDCKDMDPERYHRYTGGDGSLMRSNLQFLLKKVGPEKILVRVPLIPDHNTPEDRSENAEILRGMGVTRLDLFDYRKTEG